MQHEHLCSLTHATPPQVVASIVNYDVEDVKPLHFTQHVVQSEKKTITHVPNRALARHIYTSGPGPLKKAGCLTCELLHGTGALAKPHSMH